MYIKIDIPDTTAEATNLWNKKHCELIIHGSEYRNSRIQEWVVDLLTKAKVAYYGNGDTILGDDAYDKLEWYLRALNPKHTFLMVVGSKNKD